MAILRASTGPYASVRLAVFEPLVVEWCSVPGVSNVLVNVLHRAVPERTRDVAGGTAAPTIGRFSWRLATPPLAPGEPRGPEVPQALVRPSARALALAPEEIARRAEVVRKLLSNERLDLDEMLAQLTSARMPHLLAAGGLRAALSPVGAMHLYRQLYFDGGASVGPLEHAFTVAPKEQLEVVQESTYTLTVKSASELTERRTVRRTLTNDTAEPVNYGLRRVLRNVRVKLQSLGPRLAWQLYIERPGANLAQSRMVMFREAEPIAPGQVPNAPPRPQGGVETGDQTVKVQLDINGRFIEISVAQDPTRVYLALTIDSISDAAPEKDAWPPGVRDAAANGVAVTQTGEDGQERSVAMVYRFAVTGDARLVTVTYSIAYDPSAETLATWNQQVEAAQAVWEAQQMEAAFERAKRLIEARSRVTPRPAADLRDEERYELLNRMISLAFHDLPAEALPSPVEIELFNRYFEVAAMFHAVHPAWWRPRYGIGREEYEVTEESEPARFGKSLGWLIQLDGDRRRNELLNSPWVRVCVPIRPGVEREAVDWLSRHIEGRVGFSLAEGSPLATLLADIEARRRAEDLAAPGPDFVTVDGTVPPGREDAAAAYPVIDEFEVTVPTEGFIYERIATE